ncbi:MAG: PA2169 family four-helix-bundle protein [Sporolactobacillus sp.]|jgi:bacterioferritin|nr:PA2169 family four-helix-bundle protein [Sporolactobacillus sp.]
MQNQELDALNELLKGLYMGIHAYDRFIEKAKNMGLKQKLQTIQREIREQTLIIIERIQDLDGTPIENEGILGAVQNYLVQLKVANKDDQIIKKAIEGEHLGIGMAEKTVRGHLSPESEQAVHKVLEQDRRHVQELRKLVEKML